MKVNSDLEYTKHGVFTDFYPTSPDGERAYRELMGENGGYSKVFTHHLDTWITKLRRARAVILSRYAPQPELE